MAKSSTTGIWGVAIEAALASAVEFVQARLARLTGGTDFSNEEQLRMEIKRQSIVLNGMQFNFSITPDQMAAAMAKVDKYSVAEKVRRMDDVFVAQPAVLAAAVQLGALGVDLRLADHAIYVLLVLFECFSAHVPDLPKIEQATVQKAFDDVAAMVRLYDGETAAEASRLQGIWMQHYKEHAVIAFVAGYLSSAITEPSRDQELVWNCCLAMTNAYLCTYEAMP